MSPQSATPTSISDHSEGFNPNNLPSLITYAIICMYSVLTRCTVAIVDSQGCSAQVTDRMNLARKAGNKTPHASLSAFIARAFVKAGTAVASAGFYPLSKTHGCSFDHFVGAGEQHLREASATAVDFARTAGAG